MSKNYKVAHNVVSCPLRLPRTILFVILLIMFVRLAVAENEEVHFNSEFLRSAIDVSNYSHGNPVPTGEYTVDLYVNDRWKGRTEVYFKKDEKKSAIAKPCFNTKLVSSIGINPDGLTPDIVRELKSDDACVKMADISTALAADYDVSTQRLNIHAPQAYLIRNYRGYVSPELWDDGITASTLQYDYNAYHSEMSGSDSLSTQYLGLRGGVNWDVWRLRYRGSFNWTEGRGWNYDNTNTFLERAIVPMRGKLIMGESSTDGQVFDSVGFHGVMLMSDERMFTDSQRGFAPIINGIANTNALVRVTQHGGLIYESTVPPGPFVIDDLYPTGTGGDLLVTVKEADGSEHSFTVTFASIAELLRPGTSRYTLMAGRYRNTSVNEEPEILLGTLRHGFTNLITGYTGVLGGEGYQSISGGVALNSSVGAISADITHARTKLHDDIDSEGQSIRFSFAKILPVTDTNITLASYRYSSSGYYDINDAMLLRDIQQRSTSGFYSSSINRKNRIQISAAQTISDTWGSFNFSSSTQDYWNRSGQDTEYRIGYSNTFKRFTLNINANRTRDLETGHWDNKIAIGISLPLGGNARSGYLNSTYVQVRNHQGVQNSVVGTLGEDRQFTYNAFGSVDHYKDTNDLNTGGVSGSWTSPWSTIGGSFSAGNGYQQYSMNISGGAIAWQNGIVLTPIMGDTMAVIEADDAKGARITSNNSLRLDSTGKAAVPYLTPYRQNTIELDPKGLSNDVSLEVTSQNSVPTAGAIVLMKYKTDVGNFALMAISHAEEALPFGSAILDENNNTVGYITQGGQGFIRVKNESGRLHVQWSDNGNKQCAFNYHLPAKQNTAANEMPHLRAVCQ
ncbi:fimbria/pilus outer membrane usher protein [Klebsiella sp. PL-2018]|uniref:fimbria/pilus outer membrane usher protein n=1 Tax=Klebsiella sp. PL-2018 TaxID=2851540 RepID=UPI001C22C56B|nr:fimbria/pilus outer membrane usher protein [Klebsiella sp. PL-2018]QXD01096.1 Putative outer membrane fimbrial usher porin precursor [Klebsiella sp. PL-2018]